MSKELKPFTRPIHGFTQDGYRPAPATIDRPSKVQGGYQAPGGGGRRPAPPTTGSGVQNPSNPPPKK